MARLLKSWWKRCGIWNNIPWKSCRFKGNPIISKKILKSGRKCSKYLRDQCCWEIFLLPEKLQFLLCFTFHVTFSKINDHYFLAHSYVRPQAWITRCPDRFYPDMSSFYWFALTSGRICKIAHEQRSGFMDFFTWSDEFSLCPTQGRTGPPGNRLTVTCPWTGDARMGCTTRGMAN